MHAMFVENIIMFIPFGVLLPILFRKFRSGWAYILTGFICSCSIEILQHITQTGYLQLDDVVTNRTGTLLGWLAWKVNRKIWTRWDSIASVLRYAQLKQHEHSKEWIWKQHYLSWQPIWNRNKTVGAGRWCKPYHHGLLNPRCNWSWLQPCSIYHP